MIKKFNYVENDTHIFVLILCLCLDMRVCVCVCKCSEFNSFVECLLFPRFIFSFRFTLFVVEFNLVLLGNATTVSEDLIFISTLFADHIYTAIISL